MSTTPSARQDHRAFRPATAPPVLVRGHAVEAAPPADSGLPDEDQVWGSFVGHLRRIQPSRAGLMVQVFAENGPNSDIVTTMHLNKYLDKPARVAIHALKDAVGNSLRSRDGAPDLVFRCRLQRPRATRDGQAAQFFTPNGTDADTVAVINTTRYFDALVFVTIFPDAVSDDVIRAAVQDDHLSEAARTLSSGEEAALRAAQRAAREAERLLAANGFYRNPDVWAALDPVLPYAAWLQAQPCAHPGPLPCENPVADGVTLPALRSRWAMVPLCTIHADAWQRGHVPDGMNAGEWEQHLATRAMAMTARWARTALRQDLRCPDGYDPRPRSLIQWAVGHGIGAALPPAVLALDD